jgi:hypothetical protein
MKEGIRKPSVKDKLEHGQVIIHEHLNAQSIFEPEKKKIPWGAGIEVNIGGIYYELQYTKKVFKAEEHGDTKAEHQGYNVAVDWVAEEVKS